MSAANLIRELLGANRTARSAASGFGVLLIAIWVLLEWQGWGIRRDIAAFRSELVQQRMELTREAQIGRERSEAIAAEKRDIIDTHVVRLEESLTRYRKRINARLTNLEDDLRIMQGHAGK